MTATTTIRYPTCAAVEFERAATWTRELPLAAKTLVMVAAAPVLGLVFVLGLPLVGLAVAAWMAAKALAPALKGAAPVVKRLALFAAAPFFGLAYLVAFPLVGLGALMVCAYRTARK